MKTTVDIPEKSLSDAMRFAKAQTKREAILTAIEEYNRRHRVEELISQAGSFPNFPTNEEIEAPDIADTQKLRQRLKGKQ